MMAQDNSCLKTLCNTFSVLYGILGVIFLFIGILASSYKNEFEECNMENCILIFCSIGSVMVALALLGSIGVHKEKKWALRVYTTFLVLHTAGCVPVLHSLLSVHTKVNNDALRQLTPLNRADGRIQKAINKMQTVAECCGLLGYEDWGYSIPQSCHCPPDYENKALKCHHVKPSWDTWYWIQDNHGKSVEVYKQPCGPIILRYLEMGMKFAVGLFITTALIVVILTILHLVLFCQDRERIHTRPWRSCEDATLPSYKGLHEVWTMED
ncbi:hypothetical protein AGOR_G00180050 [Albula goreensis]|uniref:Tetraspanin n=1 Tax=Albula goreensis TaxID=1534307 RepID=A0A8T3CS00_9TELE|nr:hypothetical protein AGOR_G00180050 [Albula goreensis]